LGDRTPGDRGVGSFLREFLAHLPDQAPNSPRRPGAHAHPPHAQPGRLGGGRRAGTGDLPRERRDGFGVADAGDEHAVGAGLHPGASRAYRPQRGGARPRPKRLAAMIVVGVQVQEHRPGANRRPRLRGEFIRGARRRRMVAIAVQRRLQQDAVCHSKASPSMGASPDLSLWHRSRSAMPPLPTRVFDTPAPTILRAT
jgi:hypothetical protein